MSVTQAEPVSPSTNVPLLERQRELLNRLREIIRWRTQTEVELEQHYRRRLEEIEAQHRRRLPEIENRYRQQRAELERQLQESLQALQTEQESETAAIEAEWHERRASLEERAQQERENKEREFEERKWELNTEYEAAASDLEERSRKLELKLQEQWARIKAIREEARQLLQVWRQPVEKVVAVRPKFTKDDDLLAIVQAKTDLAREYLESLKTLVLPRCLEGKRPWWLATFLAVLLAPLFLIGYAVLIAGQSVGQLLAGSFWAEHALPALVTSLVGAILGSGLILLGIYWLARWRVWQLYRPLLTEIYEACKAGQICKEAAEAAYRRQAAELKARRQKFEETLKAMIVEHRRWLAEHEVQSQRDLQSCDEQFRSRLDSCRRQFTSRRQQISQELTSRLAELDRQYQAQRQRIEDEYQQGLAQLEAWRQQQWGQLRQRWAETMRQIRRLSAEFHQQAYQACPSWEDDFWNHWQAPVVPAEKIPLGRFHLALRDWKDAIPDDADMRAATPSELWLAAALEFPERCSCVVRLPENAAANDQARAAALRFMQMYLFRLLATIPPGKLRFTILDPVGLGEPFSAFMHLADYDEQLVTSRIWTEPQHIEQRLADLTAHMETVLQTYLRNQYATIEEYNQQAGELAEPYRILVVADFPTNFTSEAARRLASIIASGARCGVYVVISVDPRLPMPHGFQLEDLERAGAMLVWKNNRLAWNDADFGQLPLHLDPPPPDQLCTRLMHEIGKAALAAKRVEVPFSWVAPPPEKRWASDSSSGIEIPIGRCGATKRQYFRLGQGTAQHVLIAGKTGSGKSTLLHVLITNLALHYSPQEVELYLVDFKKGVEFKTYATHRLPHARVIAIESEREFGLSVLQRLDAELRHRGELFRQAGVQDIRAYRQVTGQPLPRILLLVDEFQEFFVEDDRIAQESAQLLDRLVRQGRAFGLHVVLGSQTLGGAYTLARSTLDQMAVRIALQCSEADSALILSEDNTAARLLSRPGEAIYNDANGLVEGNSPFQIVWLSDATRDQYLREIEELARRRQLPALPQVVFEGNAPSILASNTELWKRISGQVPPSPTPVVWFGDSIAIREPTHLVLHRHTGANLAILGQDETLAAGMFCASLIALAAQLPVRAEGSGSDNQHTATFYVLDGSLEGTPISASLTATLAVLPQPIRLGRWREVSTILQELHAEMQKRIQSADAPSPTWVLWIFGLHRFRDLRREEDDYGFGFDSSKPPSAARLLAELLREGPTVGIHVFLWCDTLTNLQRSFDRAALRELNYRIAMQMSANDSSNFLDSPLASRLGPYRAYFYSEEQGRLEKFRPYGLPDEAYLQQVALQLRSR
jgi:S-DNA-T family DNA segregation ATPase FtsK/SpoIIIE